MYFPEFSITTNILNNIGKIEASKALIEHLPLFPAWENSLQLEAKIKNAFHANHFEGNSLNFDHVKGFFNGREIWMSVQIFAVPLSFCNSPDVS